MEVKTITNSCTNVFPKKKLQRVLIVILLFAILLYNSVGKSNLIQNLPNPKLLLSASKNDGSYKLISFESLETVNFESIPKEALNPMSQYFGLKYKNTYGLPSNIESNYSTFYETLSKGLPGWESYFPDLRTALTKYISFNFMQESRKFTSSFSSCLVDRAGDYKVGDEFKATITVVDHEKQPKKFGGDYFRVRLMKTSTTGGLPDGIPCSVKDNTDGTYAVSAPLPVPGEYRLEVLLCSSTEAIASYIEWSAGRVLNGITLEAKLLSNETVKCNSDLPLSDKYKGKKLCNYSNPRNAEPWFCSKPPSGICFPITFQTPFGFSVIPPDNLNINKPFNIVSRLKDRYKSYQNISGTGYTFKVLATTQETEPQIMARIQRGVKDGKYLLGNSANPQPNGFSHNGRWVSLVQNYDRLTMAELAKCFSNKVVYLLGDSTMRQFFEFSQAHFQLKLYESDSSNSYHVPRLGRHEKMNITVYYRPHGPPIRNPGPLSVSPYMSDTINGIQIGGKDVVIVINLGLHYIEYDSMFFIHRLQTVKTALESHLVKFPDTKIIIKGMNVAKLEMLPFEWLVHRYDVLLKEFFKVVHKSVFVDLWDMTTLWPLSTDYHPPPEVILEQAYLLFSYICDQ